MAGLFVLYFVYNWYDFALVLISMQYALIIYNMMNMIPVYRTNKLRWVEFVVELVAMLILQFSVFLFLIT